jgi:SAM-dependent methyltransferase
VDAAIAQQLVALNHQFYQSLAAPFSASRGRLHPGVQKVLRSVPADANVLDLGCGNGGVVRELAKRGHSGRYVGVDFSAELLQVARKNVRSPTSYVQRPTSNAAVQFIQADFTTPSWNLQSPISSFRFDFVFAFAVLHHIPSRELRLDFLRQVRRLLASGGRFVLSNWQFMNSPRLRDRIQSWETIDLAEIQVDAGDYLLDWRSGGSGLRYVHHFDEVELGSLAAEAGFDMVDSVLSDGKGGNLALYQVWTADHR